MNSQPRFHSRCLIAAMAFVALPSLIAFGQTDVTSNTAPVQRFLDSDTAVVAWADLSQIDLDDLAKFMTATGPSFNDIEQAKAARQGLTKLGVTRVYWISDLAELSRGPRAVVVPVPQENADAVLLILNAIAESTGGTTIADGQHVLIGDPEEISRLQGEHSGKPDAEFLSTVNNIKHPHAVALRTPAEAMLPLASLLPEIFGADSRRATTAAELLWKLKSVTLSGTLPPSNMRLQVNTNSKEAAAGVATLLNDWTTSEIKEKADVLQMRAVGSSVTLESKSEGDTSAIVDSLKILASPARRRAQRMTTMNSLKQIGLAMHNFYDTYGTFPPQALANKDGKRLLSWRVLILPYLDEYPLYKEFRLDEPWDSPHNIKLAKRMPFTYRGSQTNQADIEAGKTRMVAPLIKVELPGGKKASYSVFARPEGGTRFQDINDGTSNTLLVVEAGDDQTVLWTKPEDVELVENDPVSPLLDKAAKGFHACMCDGAARFFSATTAAKTVRALLTIDGGEIIEQDEL